MKRRLLSRLLHPRHLVPLACSVAVLLVDRVVSRAAQSFYTASGTQTLTNATSWDNGTGVFGQWSIPWSDPALTLSLGNAGLNVDQNLTLNRLILNNTTSTAVTVASSLGGNLAFAGAASITGNGSLTSMTISAPVVLGTSATGLTFNGGSGQGATVSGVINTNTTTPVPVTIATTARSVQTGIVTLGGANRFVGGVTLNSGTLQLSNSQALGDRGNVLTVNGGTLTGATTIANRVVLQNTLKMISSGLTTFRGVISGVGQGLEVQSTVSSAALFLSSANSYSGPTLIGGQTTAGTVTDGAGALVLNGAGSILNTSGITIAGNAALNLDFSNATAAGISRVGAATAINSLGGTLVITGNGGVVRQSFGTVTGRGQTELRAVTSGASTPGSGTEMTIANLVRNAGGTFAFQGPNLGAAAVVAGTNPAQGNVILTQINGGAPSAALVGGGGAAGSKTISIIPWATGEASNLLSIVNLGQGFVTYAANGVRALDTANEYRTDNNFTTLNPTENVRVTGTITPHTAPTTVNSLWLASPETLNGGANALTITSGALGMNTPSPATIANPVLFGPGGSSEAVVHVAAALSGTSTLTLSGGFTAGALTKSGHGDLIISSTNPTISGAITINAGEIVVDSVARLGGASSIAMSGTSRAANRTGLSFTHTSGTQTLAVPITASGGIVGLAVAAGGTLAVTNTISGNGGLSLVGPGTINLSGPNTYTGGTILQGSAVVGIGGDSALGSATDPAAGYLTVNAGTINLTGAWTSARQVNVTNTFTLNTGTNAATLSGPFFGGGTLTKTGEGTLTFTARDNSFSGALAIGSSSLAGGTVALVGDGQLNGASIFFGASGGQPAGTYALDLSGATDIDPDDGSSTPVRSFNTVSTGTGAPGVHTLQLGAAVGAPVDVRVESGTLTGGSVIAGFGKLIKIGTGALALTTGAGNSFTGGVEIRGGTLSINTDSQLGNSTNGVTLLGGNLTTTANLTTTRSITLGATPVPLLAGNGTAVTQLNSISAPTTTTLTLNGALGGTGGVLFNGAGTTALGATNTFQGDLAVSTGTVSFDNPAQLGAASGRIRLLSGTLLDRATSSTQTVTRPLIVTGAASIAAADGATLEFTSPVAANATITKPANTSTLRFTADSPAFFSTIGVAGGTLALTGSGQMRRATVNLTGTTPASTFDLADLTREIGTIGAGTGNFGSGNTVALGTNGKLTVGFNPLSMTWDGNVTGGANASVTKVGVGALTVTGAGHTFSGGLHLLSGDTTVSGTGAVPLQSAMTLGGWNAGANNAGGFLSLNNSASNADRLADTQVVYSNAAEINLTSNGITASSETVGSLRGAGMTTITMTGGTLNFGDATTGLTRLNGGTFLVRSAGGLGNGAPLPNLANLTFGNSGSLPLIGGAGAAGSTTISILPFAVAGTSTSDTGSTFVTYGGNGVRPLNPANSEYLTQTNAASVAGGSSADNVRLNNSAAATTKITGGDLTINSLLIAGTANTTRLESNAAEKLTLTSGALLNSVANVWSAGVPLGLQMAELLSGATNTRELNAFTPADLVISAKISTSGGLTKSGVGNLFLANSANSYSGATTINAGNLVIEDKAALGTSTSLVMGGGFLRYRGGDTTLTGFTVQTAGGSGPGLGASAGFYIASGATVTLPASSVSGNGGLIKDGTGILKLSGTNTYSGPTFINGGALAIDSPAALGTSSRVIFSGGGVGISGGQVLRFDASMTLTQDFTTNGGDTGVPFGFDTNGNNVTLNGALVSTVTTRGLYKVGAGELNLTSTAQYRDGATQVFGGTLRLSGANGSVAIPNGTGGYVGGVTVFVAPGAALVADNSVTNNNNRLPDVWDLPFGTGNGSAGLLRLLGGGELNLIGNAAGTQERVNVISLDTGTVTLNGGGTQLISGRVATTAGSSAGLIRGTNLGGPLGSGSANWLSTDLGGGSVTLAGAGGVKGTPFINILPGFMADASATGTGTDLVTYAGDTGFRPLTAGEYTSTIAPNNSDVNRAANIALTGAATLNETSAITALKLGPGASLGGTGTVQIAQGTVLATGTASLDVSAINLNVPGGTNTGLALLTSGAGTTLTANSQIVATNLLKYGGGTVVLNRGVSTGSLTLAQGTVRLGSTSSVNPDSFVATISPGATLDLSARDFTLGALTSPLNGVTVVEPYRTDGTIALGTRRLTLGGITTYAFSGDITGSGGLTKGLGSTSSVVTFYQPQSYTGSTVLRSGTLALNGAATLATSGVELRGGSLSFENRADGQPIAAGYIANRLGTTTPITLAGGTITFTENQNTVANHQLGPVTLAGGGTLTVTQAANWAPSTTTISNLIRTSGTLTLTAGSNLGLAPAALAQNGNGNARIFATQINGAAPTSALVGGSGAAGSTTVSILPWAWNSSSGSFVTYDPTNGFRGLAAAERAPTVGTDATVNVESAGAITLTADSAANSLVLSGGTSISGAFDLTLGSGALAVSSAGSISVGDLSTTKKLLTGAGNTRELVVNATGASVNLTINSQIDTTGGLTKYGAGALNLANSGNTFTGGIRINEGRLQYSTDSQLGAASNAITFGSAAGDFTARGFQLGSVTAGTTVTLSRDLNVLGYGTLIAPANMAYRLTGTISGAGSFGFGPPIGTRAVYELNGTNNLTGDIIISSGLVSFAGDAALGSGALLINTAANTDGLFLRGDWTTARNISLRGTTSLNTNGYNATLSGVLSGISALTKYGTGTLTLSEFMPYNSTPVLNAGELRLRDRGSLAAASSTLTVNAGAALTLDDTGVHASDRIHDSGSTITLSGGSFTLLGNSTTTTEEVIGTLNTGGGPATVTLVPGAGRAAILRFSTTLSIANTTATLFRGPNLGVNAPGTADSANLLPTGLNSQSFTLPLTGGGGAAGSSSVGIIRGAYGDPSTTGLGTQLVTMDLDKGVRLLTPAEYRSGLVDGAVIADNVRLTGAAAITGPTTANALWLDGGGSVTGTVALSLASNTLLATATGNSIGTPITAVSGTTLAVGGPGDLSITGAITSSTGLTKMGAGTLTLSGNNNGLAGTIWLRSGVVAVTNVDSLGTGAIRFLDGELRNTSTGPLTLANTVQIDGIMRIGGTQALTFDAAVTINNATREINVTNTAPTTISGQIDGTANVAGIGLIKSGPGLLILTGASNLYGDTTGTNRFYESYTDIIGGELRANNTFGTTTGGSVVRVKAGGTLGGTGAVGATQLLGGTLAPGDGTAGTLAARNTTFSGGTFALELSSAGTADRLFVTGTVSLTENTAITLSLLGGYTPALNDSWTILSNDGADPISTGAFRFTNAGVPIESNVLFAAAGTFFRLNYTGGDGNDLVLTAVPEPSSLGLMASALGLLGLRRRRKTRA